MSQSQNIGRFRVNPVEIVIFLAISVIFLNSVYNLLYVHQGFQPSALTPMSSNPISEGRSPASIASSLMTVDVPCERSLDQDTLANKARLHGSFCGSSDHSLVKATIVNHLNQFTATVFTDPNTRKYSTDYIPLTSGENHIHLEFSFNNGEIFSQELKITKN